MPNAIRRPASSVSWASPSGHPCTLAPMSGGQGMLEIEIDDGMVIIHSRNCLLTKGADNYTEIGEFETTLPLDRCQITWHYVEKTEADVVERSAYFQQ